MLRFSEFAIMVWIWLLGLEVEGMLFEYWVWGMGFGVWGLGFGFRGWGLEV